MKVFTMINTKRDERGSSLLEVLVSILVVGAIFGGLVGQYSSSVSASYDHSIRIAAQVQAQAVLQTIISELRVLGNGVPFDQANFQIDESTLSDPSVTEPIDISVTDGDHLAFRLNESGTVHLLTTDFDPTATLNISLTGVEGVEAGDEIYLTNSVVGGDEGLYATVASVNTATNVVTLDATYITTLGATFDTGSILEVVPVIVYDSPSDGSGVTRDSGDGAVLLANNSVMAITYYSFDGSVIAPPLTNAIVVNSLRSIEVTITVTSDKKLSDGSTYSTSVQQRVGIRNLNYVF